jgi:predicted PurR-regulated permease PerM
MNIQTFLEGVLTFLNTIILPFLLALAFLFFIWNATRYFIIGGGSEESQEKAKTLALWGIAAFVFIVSLWGIVNLIVSGLGFPSNDSVLPDYVRESPNNIQSGG